MKLYAVLFVWNEEDIIASTVKNALIQGVDKVFFVDNGSTDKTVQTAVMAGAELAFVVDTGYFDEKVKYASINAVIKQVNTRENNDFIWWMILDADEFPDARDGITIRQYIKGCHPSVNIIPALLMDHQPTHPPYFLPGYHPLYFQPFTSGVSDKKLPIIRYEKDREHIMTMGGAHTYRTADGSTLTGTDRPVIFHHFPVRTPEKAIWRLSLLTARRADGTRRIDYMDAYAQRHRGEASFYWNRLHSLKTCFKENAFKHLMSFNVEKTAIPPPVWHQLDDVPAGNFRTRQEYLFWKASALLYAGDPAGALPLFADVQATRDGAYGKAGLKGMEICRELCAAVLHPCPAADRSIS